MIQLFSDTGEQIEEIHLEIGRGRAISSADITELSKYLRRGSVTKVGILFMGKEVGTMELSLEKYRKIETGKFLQLEIRYIELYPRHRGNGYLKTIIKNLKILKHPIIGEVTEDNLGVRDTWVKVGAEFINEYDFIIK